MKKLSIFIICCFSILFTKAQFNEKVILREEFSNNDNYWDVYSETFGYVSMLNGKLTMGNNTKTPIGSVINVFIDTLHDFSITVSTSLISSEQMDGYGLVFGAKDLNNGYYFFIGTNDKAGAWRLVKYENGKAEYLSDWAASSAIKPGKDVNNRLSIKQENKNWILSINDQQVGVVKARSFLGHKLGFDVDNIQSVAFSYLTVTNYYKQVSNSGKLCEVLPAIYEESKSDFNQINTGKTVQEEHVRVSRVKKPGDILKLDPGIIVTDAVFNYISYSSYKYEYTSRVGIYTDLNEAIKKSDSLSKQLSTCLKNFIVTKLPGKPDVPPVYRINEKINGGYKSGENFIRIAKDSSLRMPRYFINVVISNVLGKPVTFITSKSDNSKLALQLKQLRGYSAKKFKDITGEFIPGSNAIGSWNREYNTSYKVENAKRNYIRIIGDEKEINNSTYFCAVFGENMTEKDGTVLFNSLFEKLKKVLGSEMVYSVQNDWAQGLTAGYKLISFMDKQDDTHYAFDLKIERAEDKYKVEVIVY